MAPGPTRKPANAAASRPDGRDGYVFIVTAAEQAAFEVPFVPLAEARALVELYAEKIDRKFERPALKYVRPVHERGEPVAEVAQVAAVLAERGMLMRGL